MIGARSGLGIGVVGRGGRSLKFMLCLPRNEGREPRLRLDHSFLTILVEDGDWLGGLYIKSENCGVCVCEDIPVG